MKNSRAHIIPVFFTFFSVKAQLANPVKWQCRIEKKTGDEYLLTFEGIIEKGWHLYSQFTPEGGPAPLEILFPDSKGKYRPAGKGTESETKTEYNEFFGVNETFFIRKVKIQQKIQVTNPLMDPIQLELTYQICRNVCIPQKMYFEFDVQSLNAKVIAK